MDKPREYFVTFEAKAKAIVSFTARDEEELNNMIEDYIPDHDEFELEDDFEATEYTER